MQSHKLASWNRLPLPFLTFPRVTTLGTAVLLGTLTLAEISAGAQSVAPPVAGGVPAPVPASNTTTAPASVPTSDIASILDADQNPSGQAPPDPDAPKPKRTIYVGPNVGVYLPTSSKTRSQFGSAWTDFGLGFGLNHVKLSGGFRPDLHVLSQSANGNRFFIGLVGVEYRRSLLFGTRRRATPPAKNGEGAEKPQDGNGKPGDGGQPNRPDPRSVPYLLPYFGFSADLAVGDLRDVSEGVHSGVRSGFSGTAFLGLNVGKGFYFETRYREVTQFKGFDLSGFNVTAGYRFRLK